MYIHVFGRGGVGYLPQSFSTQIFLTRSVIELGGYCLLEWLASSLQGSYCFYFPITAIQETTIVPSYWYGFCKSKLKSFKSSQKPLTYCIYAHCRLLRFKPLPPMVFDSSLIIMSFFFTFYLRLLFLEPLYVLVIKINFIDLNTAQLLW